jgi:diadenosine tetraphosphate (Ap4A) HIT family hydrolase
MPARKGGARAEACHVCATLTSTSSDQLVYDDGLWAGYLVADVPGWVMLAAKQHVEGMWSLSPEQASGLGDAVRSIGSAVKATTGADRVHLVYLGQSAPHFHMGFFPRLAGEPALFDNARLADAARSQVDPERARTVGADIRAAIER